jgi:hypothetical protein
MDKMVAIILSILAVVLVVAVIVIGDVMPAIDAKSDSILQQMNGLDYSGN